MSFSSTKIRHRVRHDMWEAQGRRCYYCGKPLELAKTTFDHRIPLAKGGGKGTYNLVIACKPCNVAKGDTLWEHPACIGFKVQGQVQTTKSAETWQHEFQQWVESRGETFNGFTEVVSMEFERA